MTPETLRSLKTAIAASLITLWACLLLMTELPFRVEVDLLLFAVVAVQQDKTFFTTPMRFGFGRADFISLVALVALVSALTVIATVAGEKATVWFMSSPYYVVPVWALVLRAIVLRAARAPTIADPSVKLTPRPAASPAAPHRTQAMPDSVR